MREEPEEGYVVCRHITPEYDFLITYPSNLLEESSVYQDIFQKGEQRGVREGAQKFVLLLLEELFGKPSPQIRKQIKCLAVEQLEELGLALLYFKEPDELTAWLKQHAPTCRNGLLL